MALVPPATNWWLCERSPDRRRGRGSAFSSISVKGSAPWSSACRCSPPSASAREAELRFNWLPLAPIISVVVALADSAPAGQRAAPGLLEAHGIAAAALARGRADSVEPAGRRRRNRRWHHGHGEGLDTGRVYWRKRLTIGHLETPSKLQLRLSKLTAELLVCAMPLIEKQEAGPEAERPGRLRCGPQPSANECYAALLPRRISINWSGLKP